MQTYKVIGSDKNAGKTTAMNFVYHGLQQKRPPVGEICLSTVGINGEAVDTFDNRKKPEINLKGIPSS